jgi:hypothetical protein
LRRKNVAAHVLEHCEERLLREVRGALPTTHQDVRVHIVRSVHEWVRGQQRAMCRPRERCRGPRHTRERSAALAPLLAVVATSTIAIGPRTRDLRGCCIVAHSACD